MVPEILFTRSSVKQYLQDMLLSLKPKCLKLMRINVTSHGFSQLGVLEGWCRGGPRGF